MDELVQRLSTGEHPVEIALRPERTAAALKRRIDEYGFVHIRFTGTRGGTELGVTLDNQSSLGDVDFEHATGQITLSGQLRLNYVPVRCVASIDLSTLQGVGHLEVLDGSAAPSATPEA